MQRTQQIRNVRIVTASVFAFWSSLASVASENYAKPLRCIMRCVGLQFEALFAATEHACPASWSLVVGWSVGRVVVVAGL